jgi:glutaconate CoA-transferase subunit B
VVVTTMGVMRFRPDTKAIYLASYHPDVTPQAVAGATGFTLDIKDAAKTEPPTQQELRILREEVDPERIFLR